MMRNIQSGLSAFIALSEKLSRANAEQQLEALVDYFRNASHSDAAWALFFLSGRRLKRVISPQALVDYFLDIRHLPSWLFWESDAVVGNLAETLALMNDTLRGDCLSQSKPAAVEAKSLTDWLAVDWPRWEKLTPEDHRQALAQWWDNWDLSGILFLNKLLTGMFKLRVSRKVWVQALAIVSGLDSATIMHRLSDENWEPTEIVYQQLISPEKSGVELCKLYPFVSIEPWTGPISDLGNVQDWWLEWKWSGLRAQCIHRQGQVFLWSRDEELLTSNFPELAEMIALLPEGTVLEGDIVALSGDEPLPVTALQVRMSPKKSSSKIKDQVSIGFVAYDILEANGCDLRGLSLVQRKQMLAELSDAVTFPLIPSPRLEAEAWEVADRLRNSARQMQMDSLMLRSLDSACPMPQTQQCWWQWKPDLHTVTAVLTYAQASGRQAMSTFELFTFAIWHGEELVPIAKTTMGLSPREIGQLSRWVQDNVLERFGPVCTVEPVHVFELGFEEIEESKRHKAGVLLRGARILRWRTDLAVESIDTLAGLQTLLPGRSGGGTSEEIRSITASTAGKAVPT